MPAAQQIALPFTPRPHQQAAFERLRRFSVLVWHRRAGKTVFCILLLIDDAIRQQRSDGRYAYIAPLLKQAKQVAWDYLRRFVEPIPGVKVNESELSVVLPNGAKISLYGADNPDALRGGYFDGVVLDEMADMRPNVWTEIIRPALADRKGFCVFIGTPRGVNAFSKLYGDAIADTTGDWHGEMLTVDDTDALAASEVAALRREMSEAEFAQELLCDFGAAVVNAMIPLPLVREAMGKHLIPEQYNWAPKILGVDVARYGDDKTVIQPRQGLACFRPRKFEKKDTMFTAGAVAESIERWEADAANVDVTGVGAGVYDRLVQLNFRNVHPVEFGSKASNPTIADKRTEMWMDVNTWLQAGGALPSDLEIQRDLCAPTYTFKDHSNRVRLESKDSMRARGVPSPNTGDAIALTFAWDVPPPFMRDGVRVHQIQENAVCTSESWKGY